MINLRYKFWLLFCIIIAVGLFSSQQEAKSQYCTPSYMYGGMYMWTTYVEIGGMINETGAVSTPSYTYFSSKTAEVKIGEKVEFTVKFNNVYPQELAIYIDWDGNGKFDGASEVAYGTMGEMSSSGYSGSFTVPDNAKVGITRMRIMSEYSYMYYPYQYPPDPCATGMYYGEAEDYNIDIKPNAPDASISGMTTPANGFRVGSNDINVTLKSGNKAPLKSVYIDWWVNNEHQGTHYWEGTLNENQTSTFKIGNVNLDYPANGPFNAFNFRFQTRNPNDFEEDGNPSNDVYIVNRTPILNDAGVLGFFGPPEGFGPGITQVRARVRNYSPKPLTSVIVHWTIDGVEQNPVTFNNINIPRDQTQDLILGTYNFYAKTPLGPFTVECYTEKPNGLNDEDLSNDKYNGGIGPSLAAGTYTVGGSNAHFSTPAEAASYINSSGIFGPGKVTFQMNKGIYDGQIVLNNTLPNKNPIEFINTSNYPSDVIISFAPTAQNNFIVLLDGMNEIKFQNLTFVNNSFNFTNGGNIIDARNVDGLYINKVIFNGVASSPRNNNNYNNVRMTNCTNVDISNNAFNNGAIGIHSDVTLPIMPYIKITNNEFVNFSWIGINSQIAKAALPTGSVVLSNNKFLSNSGIVPNFGIVSHNSTTISNNEFSGLAGTGSATDAVISVKHDSPDVNETAEIKSNRINGTNLNGILVDGANTFMKQNYVNIRQTSAFDIAAVRLLNSTGGVGSNQIIGVNAIALNIVNSPSLDFVYNSVVSESNNLPTARLNNAGRVMRNIIGNNGTAPAYHVISVAGSNDNIFFSKGNIINDNGMIYSDLAPWIAKGYDAGSKVATIEFESINDLHIKYYSGVLLPDGGSIFQTEGSYASLLEMYDYDGNERISFFIGSHELALSIRIENQSDGFTDCVGSTDKFLSVSAGIDYNAPMTYQWQLDGNDLVGEIEPVLYFKNLKYNQGGMYRCLVRGPGATKEVYTMDIPVYVATPTDIIRQPQSQSVENGMTVVLTFDAHVNGMNIEDAITNNQVKVQWYRYFDETTDIPLVDNANVAGSKSNYLTFRDFSNNLEGEYYATIDGLCGLFTTNRVTLTSASLEIEIVRQPINHNECVGQDVIFMIDATTPSSLNLTYQWYKDGVILEDNLPKMEGTKSHNLIIYDLQTEDAGNYYVVVKLGDTEVTKQSETGELKIKVKPTILLDPQEATVEAGKQLSLEVIAEGSYEGEVLNYKWYRNGELVQDSDDQYYIVDVTTQDDAGEYYVMVTNDCGSVQSQTITVTITTGVSSVIEATKNGYSLSTAVPNPVQNNSVINFAVPTESFVKITLTNANGTGSITLADGHYSKGHYIININAAELNLASGTYFYYLESNGVRLAQKLVVIR